MFSLRQRSQSASALASSQKNELKAAAGQLKHIADMERTLGEAEHKCAASLLRFSADDALPSVSQVGAAYCQLYQLWAEQRIELADRLQAAAKELSSMSPAAGDVSSPLHKELSAAADRLAVAEKRSAKASVSLRQSRLLAVDLQHARDHHDRSKRMCDDAHRRHHADRIDKLRMFLMRTAGAHGFASKCNELVFKAVNDLAHALPECQDENDPSSLANRRFDASQQCDNIVAHAKEQIARWHQCHGTPRKAAVPAGRAPVRVGHARASLSSPSAVHAGNTCGGDGSGHFAPVGRVEFTAGRTAAAHSNGSSSTGAMEVDGDAQPPPPYDHVQFAAADVRRQLYPPLPRKHM